MDVNSAAVAKVVKAPNFVEQLITGEYAIVVGCKEVEQLKLLRRNIDGLALDLQLILLQADF